MRTTLNIDEDILRAAKEIGRREHKSAGQVISELARQALAGTAANENTQSDDVLGFQPFPKRGGIVTNELIDALRDEDVY